MKRKVLQLRYLKKKTEYKYGNVTNQLEYYTSTGSADLDAEEFGKDSVVYDSLQTLSGNYTHAKNNMRADIHNLAEMVRGIGRLRISGAYDLKYAFERDRPNSTEIVLASYHMITAYKLKSIREATNAIAINIYGNVETDNGDSNSYRHAVWNALMVKEILMIGRYIFMKILFKSILYSICLLVLSINISGCSDSDPFQKENDFAVIYMEIKKSIMPLDKEDSDSAIINSVKELQTEENIKRLQELKSLIDKFDKVKEANTFNYYDEMYNDLLIMKESYKHWDNMDDEKQQLRKTFKSIKNLDLEPW